MDGRWSRVLGATGAGASVMLVLFLLTVFSEDRPLWGINPDLQIAVAVVAAGFTGLLVYSALGTWSPGSMALGSVLGAAGFGVVLLATMAFVAAFNAPSAYYAGWDVNTEFEEQWNATKAEQALTSQGFEVINLGETGLQAHRDEHGDRVTVHIEPARGSSGEEVPPGFTMRVFFERSVEVGSYHEARQQAEDERPVLEDEFRELLDGFEAATGWGHVGEPTWEAGIMQT